MILRARRTNVSSVEKQVHLDVVLFFCFFGSCCFVPFFTTPAISDIFFFFSSGVSAAFTSPDDEIHLDGPVGFDHAGCY